MIRLEGPGGERVRRKSMGGIPTFTMSSIAAQHKRPNRRLSPWCQVVGAAHSSVEWGMPHG
jgi:hypothetical protein